MRHVWVWRGAPLPEARSWPGHGAGRGQSEGDHHPCWRKTACQMKTANTHISVPEAFTFTT